MSTGQFFKSNIFKCLVTLLCVLLVSGIFLTLMNSLLTVTDEERFERAINKIYGKSVSTVSLPVADYNSNATINEAYAIKDDGNYLIKATGKGGFENGTVTCWVVVLVNGRGVSGIGKVVIDSSKNQSYIGNITDKFLECFVTAYDGTEFTPSSDGFIKTGATFSAGAICNAVNAAIDYVNGSVFGNVAEDIYENYLYTENIQTLKTSHIYNEEDGSVTFTVVSKGYGMAAGDFTSEITVNAAGVITVFKVLIAGSTSDAYTDKATANSQAFVGKDLADLLDFMKNGATGTDYSDFDGSALITSGATNSSFALYNAALFAAANYNTVIAENTPEGDETENEGDTDDTDDNDDNNDNNNNEETGEGNENE